MSKVKYVFVGLLIGAFALPWMWVGDPVVVGQTVTVDSTQSPVVVEAVADLANVGLNDGSSVIIKTGAEQGLWRYSKTSSATVGTSVLNGPGGVGRFLSISNSAGTFGGISGLTNITADEITDDTAVEFGVLQGSSAKALTLAELKKTGVQVVNLLQKGADPTGASSSATALDDAIDEAIATGSYIYAPPGTYDLTGWTSKTITQQVVIVGSPEDRPVFEFPDGAATALIKNDGYLRIENVVLDFGGSDYGIEFPSAENGTSLKLVNCLMRNAARCINGLGAPTGVKLLHVEGCEFTDCSYAIGEHNQKTIQRISIVGNYFHDMDDRGEATQVNAIALGGVWSALTEFDSESVHVERNTIRNITNANVSECHAIINYLPYAVISGNVINTVEAASGGDGEGIYNKGYAARITRNVIVNGCADGEGALAIKGGDYSVASGNVIHFDGNSVAASGIFVQSDYCIVRGNHVVGTNDALLSSAIASSGAFGTAIIGNTIRGFQDSAANGISASQSTGTTITNNDIRDCSPGSSGGVFAAVKITAPTKLSGLSIDASTDVITKASHGITENCPVVITSTSSVPGGTTSGQVYYAVSVASNTLKIAKEPSGAAVDITDTGSGTVYLQVVCSGTVVKGNVFRRLGPSSRGVYINRSGLIKDVTIESNEFDAVLGSSIYMDLSGGDDEVDGVDISHNKFCNARSAAAYALAGIDVGNCKRLKIKGNEFVNYTGENGSYNTAGILLTHNVAGENDVTEICDNWFVNITNTASTTRGRCINLSTSTGVVQTLVMDRNRFSNSYYGMNWSNSANPVSWRMVGNYFDSITDVINGTWTASSSYVLRDNYSSGIVLGELNVTQFSAGTLGATETFDWRYISQQTGVLDQNCTISFTAPSSPGRIVVVLAQNGTGGYTVTWPTIIWKSSAQQPDPTANAKSIHEFYYDGTSYYELNTNN